MKKEMEGNEFVHEKVKVYYDGKEITTDISNGELDALIPSAVDESKIRGGRGSNAITKPLSLEEKILHATLDSKNEER